jgi:hypothetical protein
MAGFVMAETFLLGATKVFPGHDGVSQSGNDPQPNPGIVSQPTEELDTTPL